MATEFYTTTTRTMLKYVREVGAMPFVLFEYYQTYETAPDGIRPSLETIAIDLGILDKKGKPSKSAVCNLKKILIEKKWIKEENGRIILLKSFRISECCSEILNETTEKEVEDSDILNGHSEILNDDSEFLNGTEVALIGFTNKEFKEEEKEEERERTHAPDNFQNYAFLMNLELTEIHAHFFADKYKLELKDKQIIQNRIIDKRAWILALVFWYENSYLAKSIGKQCDKYDEILIERVKKQNGSIQKHNETERERRNREAFERIEFSKLADEFLESQGIIQVGGV